MLKAFIKNIPLVKKRYLKKEIEEYITWKKSTRYSQIYDILSHNKVKNILEIGIWNGYNAYEMINICKKKRDEVNYYGFDLFEDITQHDAVLENAKIPPSKAEVLSTLKLTGANINLYKGYTKDTLKEAYSSLPKMDFIFVDGGHSIETIRNDMHYALQLIDAKSVVILDDYLEDDNELGCKWIIENELDKSKYNIEVLPRQDVFNNDNGIKKINLVKLTLK
jgi:predicted O-methyltransferase YrrM